MIYTLNIFQLLESMDESMNEDISQIWMNIIKNKKINNSKN